MYGKIIGPPPLEKLLGAPLSAGLEAAKLGV